MSQEVTKRRQFMAYKRTAKSGDFNRVHKSLSEQGVVKGHPKSIIKKTGFDGSWNELRNSPNIQVFETEHPGRYAVTLCEEVQNDPISLDGDEEPENIDPDVYALCAENYLLGLEGSEEFTTYEGPYEEIDVVRNALAYRIDSSIGGLYLPYETEKDIEVYALDRSLMYTAPGDGHFRLYGSHILSEV